MTKKLYIIFAICLTTALVISPVKSIDASETKSDIPIERISPEKTRSKVLSGQAILVCSYDDNKCKKVLMEGALMKSEFEQKLPSLPKNQEIIFYCG